MYKSSKKLLVAVMLSAAFGCNGTLNAQADSLSLSDFSEEVQAALASQPTTYGEGDTQKYFEFQYDDNGNIVMVEVSAPTDGAYTITYNYDGTSNTRVENYNSIDNISGNFIDQTYPSSGAAVYNRGTINSIDGDFVGNYVSGSSSVGGGAIFNQSGTISQITGNFIDNYALNDTMSANGGAVYNNNGTIGDITGSFEGNYALAETV